MDRQTDTQTDVLIAILCHCSRVQSKYMSDPTDKLAIHTFISDLHKELRD